MGSWDIHIFDCQKNIVMFAWSCCVPFGLCCMQALDAKLTDSDKNACLIAGLLSCCCGSIGGIINRHRLKNRLGIKDDPIYLDVLFWCCLPCCAVTQEYIKVMKDKKGNEKLLIWEAAKSG